MANRNPDLQEGPAASPFPQIQPPEGAGDVQPAFGVAMPAAPPDPKIATGAVNEEVYHPDLEYIYQFRAQNQLLRRIYDALVGRERPPRATIELEPGVTRVMPVRTLVDTLVLVNPTNAGIQTSIRIGTRVYNFGVPADDTKIIPLALTIENGSDVTVTGVARAYLIGHLTAAVEG